MVKFVYCVTRRPDVSPEQFYKYWLESHGPRVRKYAETLKCRRYVQSHTFDTPLNQATQSLRGMTYQYDGITEVWWDSVEDLLNALNTPAGREAHQILTDDENTFVDFKNSTTFFTQEHVIFDYAK